MERGDGKSGEIRSCAHPPFLLGERGALAVGNQEQRGDRGWRPLLLYLTDGAGQVPCLIDPYDTDEVPAGGRGQFPPFRGGEAPQQGAGGKAEEQPALPAGAMEVLCWEDLGCEAVRRLEVEDFPLTVILDAHGGDLYESGPAAYLASR